MENINRLKKLIRKASDIVGVKLDSDDGVREKYPAQNAGTVVFHNESHPLHDVLDGHRSTFSQ